MSVTLQIGTVVADRFRLLRPLGQGGMGALWVAHHTGLDIPCVLKFILGDAANNPEMRARFEREAKAAAQIRSPHVVQTLDHGIWQGLPYIAMELLEGEDLASRLARERRLSLAATRRIVEDVGKALRRAHEIGLIHRDMKPANIFLARQAGDEVVKILDFGIAKSTGVIDADQPTHADAVLGSPRYMSPEQVRSSTQVDLRTDLWSLGVIAFRCLTGKLPFRDGEIGDVFVSICTAPIPRASEVAPDLGPEVDRFFARALARPLEERFQSATELVEAFAALPGASESAALLAAGERAPSRRPGADGSHSAAEFLPTLPATGTLAEGPAGGSGSRLRVALFVVGGLSVIGLVAALVWGVSPPVAEPPAAEPIAAPTNVAPAPPAPLPAPSSAESPQPPPQSAPQPTAPAPAAKPAQSTHKSRRTGGASRPKRSDDLLDQM